MKKVITTERQPIKLWLDEMDAVDYKDIDEVIDNQLDLVGGAGGVTAPGGGQGLSLPPREALPSGPVCSDNCKSPWPALFPG